MCELAPCALSPKGGYIQGRVRERKKQYTQTRKAPGGGKLSSGNLNRRTCQSWRSDKMPLELTAEHQKILTMQKPGQRPMAEVSRSEQVPSVRRGGWSTGAGWRHSGALTPDVL